MKQSIEIKGSDGNSYELIHDPESKLLMSKKNGVLWIDYSGNPLVQGLFDLVNDLYDELGEVNHPNSDMDTKDMSEGFHTRKVYSEDGSYLDEELILDEYGNPIPLDICLCFAHEPGECCCNTTSWDNYRYD